MRAVLWRRGNLQRAGAVVLVVCEASTQQPVAPMPPAVSKQGVCAVIPYGCSSWTGQRAQEGIWEVGRWGGEEEGRGQEGDRRGTGWEEGLSRFDCLVTDLT